MHPQLDKVRFHECEDLMDALEECHNQEFLKRALGMCNFEKEQLSKCLHNSRLDHSKERIRASREKQKLFEKKKKQIEDETYGKNGYLKKVFQKEDSKE